MANKLIKTTYNAGEMSPLIDGRTDLSKYYNGCSKLVNGTVLPYGGITKRSGTEWIAASKSFDQWLTSTVYSLGDLVIDDSVSYICIDPHTSTILADDVTAGDMQVFHTTEDIYSKVKLFEFEFSATDTMIIEIGNYYARFIQSGVQETITKASVSNWTNADSKTYAVNDIVEDAVAVDKYYYANTAHTTGANMNEGHVLGYWTRLTEAPLNSDNLLYEIQTPYSSAEIFDVHLTQSADVLYLAHTDHHPQKMSRLATNDWTIEDVPFTGGPFLSQNVDDSLTLTFTHDEVAFEAPWYHLTGASGVLTSSTADPNGPFTTGHVGSLWELVSTRVGDVSVSQSAVGTSIAIRIKGDFNVSVSEFSAGDVLTLQRIEGNGEWQDYRTFNAASSFSATELFNDVLYRLVVSGGAVQATLTAKEQVQHGSVHIDSFIDTATVNVTVVNDVYHDNMDPVSFVSDPGTINLGGTGGGSGDVIIDLVTHGLTTGDMIIFNNITLSNYTFLNTDGTDNTTWVVNVTDSDTFTVDDSDGLGGDTGGSTETLEFGSLTKLLAITTTSMYSEDAWSGVNGYPITVTFFESRLWWAGTDNNPQTLWGSRTDDFENYAAGTLADDAITVTIQDNNMSAIEWIAARKSLVAGTANKEYAIRANNIDDPITPGDIKASPQSTHGSNHIQAQPLNDGLFYIQRSGRKMWIMKFSFADEEFNSTDATLLAEHLLESSPTDMAIQGVPESMVWLVRSDGVLLSFTYNSNEEVAAWARHVTGTMSANLLNGKSAPDALFESIAIISGSIEDDVYVSVQRTINSVVVRYIEKFATRFIDQIDEALMLDSAVVVTTGFQSQDIILASDTVRYGEGNYGSSFYGGTFNG